MALLMNQLHDSMPGTLEVFRIEGDFINHPAAAVSNKAPVTEIAIGSCRAEHRQSSSPSKRRWL
jgi:hypothetical protein